jgi:anhydro-N-acetylmuramic acid kinase
MLVIGLISGTSLDAIDAAVVKLRYDADALAVGLLAYVEYPFPPRLHERLRAILPPAVGSVAEVCELNMLLGQAFAAAALACAHAARLPLDRVDLIASHGQTVYHQVTPGRLRSTLQLGAAAVIAEQTGRTVVADFRPRDIAAGGQGAPLVPYLDRLLWSHPRRKRAAQNIGGIANVTFLPATGGPEQPVVVAFDTGPGNLLIDEAARLLSSGARSYDLDGAWAAEGQVDERLLARWLKDPYFMQPPPKSTGREYFSRAYAEKRIDEARRRGLGDADILAALTALTARSIAGAYRQFLPPVDDLILSGGGARNRTLVRMLVQALPASTLHTSDALGLPADAKEAVAFAVLGYAALHGWAGNLPSCTGARHAVALGSVTPGDNYMELVRRAACAPRECPMRAVLESESRAYHE